MNPLDTFYWYEGYCPQTGEKLSLPRNAMIEAIAQELMQQLAQDDCYNYEGKMYGVLLVKNTAEELIILKAFSGLLGGKSLIKGWVPPIPGRDKIIFQEIDTLSQLEQIKQQIITLTQLPEREDYNQLSQWWENHLNDLAICHRQRKQNRQQQRQILLEKSTADELNKNLEKLNQESQQDGIEKRNLKRQRDQELLCLKQLINQADAKISYLKQRRKQLSRQLQTQMHQVYSLTNFAGKSQSLQDFIPTGLPTGTGDCCAPKLLHYAATHQLKPLAMAEFWWGIPSKQGDKIPGQFYPACTERCQPLMGFLLSGLVSSSQPQKFKLDLEIIYEDQWIIAVNKPSGLLSVPGRYYDTFDSVLTRLRYQFSHGENLITVHRLDQDTSGILVLARDRQTHRQLSQQFQNRQVHKTYEAILSDGMTVNQGVINLPLWGDPNNRPYQQVDWQRGKPSITQFQVLSGDRHSTRVQFIPITGRTHQLRVHSVHPQGLGVSILGDRLYGNCNQSERLHLHARELSFQHPYLTKMLHLESDTPF